ncbi:MAG: YicC/YloC family endoribonuclease [Parabacteroides sp.]|nr:YicC/YloC family endoribonuclease [Parabacteroides sp.]
MIQSMTGFGKVTAELPSRKVTVEIKALNSKQLDLSTRIPAIYREKEMAVRSLLMQALERGKVEFSIYIESIGKDSSAQINQEAVAGYYAQLKEISEKLGIEKPNSWAEMQQVLRFPDVIRTEVVEADEAEWSVVENAVNQAIKQLQEFRIQEGAMLQKLFGQKIENIAQLLKDVEPYENERINKIKARICDNLEKVAAQDYDKNRFEQEMIYYIEKLDVSEEKSRLDNHLKYFLETMNSGHGQGKKLGFIAQEMGREINTLGSKSNHAEMQKIVVRMKDELEQIKEQVLNVL